ncbi:hypothetical protein [Agitococcus lubricus]|uniref:Uncharacterized protein n=1 Tax=Agitococcus lubricus TaxID=1077255 RepID=A0A2T5IYS9_9GAMM|nr:hypothetical protein [Agitococcus lubricus]PTQ89144.1 hypothetical protein C8N29_10825 [Agitococcus lubricus]
MSKLEASAELQKIAQLLSVPSTSLSFLEHLPASELAQIRGLTTDKLFNDGRKLFQKLASASKLMPAGITASIGEKVFGPMLCARIASEMPHQRAVELAQKMSIPFLAKVTLELDPRRVKDIIQNMPLDKMRAVAKELLSSHQYIVMGGFVGFMKPENLKIILSDVSNEEALLHIGFFIEEKRIVSDIMRLLPKDRLKKLIACMRVNKELWPESLALMVHIEDDLKREMGDMAAEEHEDVLNDLIETVYQLQLWQDALPLFACLSASTQYKVIHTASMQRADLLEAALLHTNHYDLWHTFLPLIEFMGQTQREILADVILKQGNTFTENIVQTAIKHQLWQPLFDVLQAIPDEIRPPYIAHTKPFLHHAELSKLIEERNLSHWFN